MKMPSRNDIDSLSVDERIRLIEVLWESLHDSPDALPLTEAQRAELDRRLAEDTADPGARMPWEQVRSRLQRKA